MFDLYVEILPSVGLVVDCHYLGRGVVLEVCTAGGGQGVEGTVEVKNCVADHAGWKSEGNVVTAR